MNESTGYNVVTLSAESTFESAQQKNTFPTTNYVQVGETGYIQGQLFTNWDPYYNYWYQWIPNYYPTYVPIWQEKSKIETAFKILQSLMNMKLVKLDKVKDFVEAVNKIAEALKE